MHLARRLDLGRQVVLRLGGPEPVDGPRRARRQVGEPVLSRSRPRGEGRTAGPARVAEVAPDRQAAVPAVHNGKAPGG
eukprot:11509818-Alexandrium_andersonii.AAC.1